ncbi:hypothetical protein [Veronia pacifica]|uniref:hypothetical protein n=1 Tax=Veronia pacifica TaxID=1080227 RepID=UPI001112F7C3|nr:hypothetical protein [Veronia pacifica]
MNLFFRHYSLMVAHIPVAKHPVKSLLPALFIVVHHPDEFSISSWSHPEHIAILSGIPLLSSVESLSLIRIIRDTQLPCHPVQLPAPCFLATSSVILSILLRRS